MAEEWNRQLDCDWLNHCKGLVTDRISKRCIYKQFQTAKNMQRRRKNWFLQKLQLVTNSPLRVMKKGWFQGRARIYPNQTVTSIIIWISQTASFELPDRQQWDPQNEETVLDQVVSDMGSRGRRREEGQIWPKNQQRKLVLAALPIAVVAWESWLFCCCRSCIPPCLVFESPAYCKIMATIHQTCCP